MLLSQNHFYNRKKTNNFFEKQFEFETNYPVLTLRAQFHYSPHGLPASGMVDGERGGGVFGIRLR
jgi:hypothetical protein